MTEAAYRVLQLGRETTFGTSVAATTIFPCDPGSGEFELDRSAESPDEDYGVAVRHQAGRGSFGVRAATGSLNANVRFEDIGHLLTMTLGTAVTSGTAAPYTHTFTGDTTTSTVKPYTIEVSDDTQDWDVVSVLCTQLDLSYDAITAPGNSMWTAAATLQGIDKAKSTATTSLTAPTTLETVEGHLTALYEGPVGTAFASLTELTGSLVSYSVSISDPKPLRAYGGTAITDDKATGHGRQKRETTFSAMLKLSATTVTNMFDIFNVSGGLPTDRRWRVKAIGSSSKSLIIDGRVRFTSVNIAPDERDGERLVSVDGYYVYDSTIASDIQIAVSNGVATLP